MVLHEKGKERKNGSLTTETLWASRNWYSRVKQVHRITPNPYLLWLTSS